MNHQHQHQPHCHSESKTESDGFSLRSVDWLLWTSGGLVAVGCLLTLPGLHDLLSGWAAEFSHSIWSLISKMWPGLLAAVVFVGLLSGIPRDLVMSILGRGGTLGGILRATLAGVLLDLCSHGILMVGTKLYERGASIGQTMAFLIASPWNSLSLTIVMITLIGIWWTLAFIFLSVLIALISGLIFDFLCSKNILPANSNQPSDNTKLKHPLSQFRELIQQSEFSLAALGRVFLTGLKESRMVFRWLFFGVVLASLIRTFVPLDTYQQLFGPTLAGLLLTIVAATVIEVCSEGSTPIAADLLTRAAAPGNAFSFLMAGVATDYTEVMVVRDTTRSWRIALFLPLITLPQVLILGFILNQVGG